MDVLVFYCYHQHNNRNIVLVNHMEQCCKFNLPKPYIDIAKRFKSVKWV